MEHHEKLVPLPLDPRPAIDCLIDYAIGGGVPLCCVAHASWHLAGYGIGLCDHPDHHPVMSSAPVPATIEDCCKKIKEITEPSLSATATEPAKAFPWQDLLPILLQILRLFLQK